MDYSMAVHKIWIEEGCISCNACEDTCPEIFEVPAGEYSKVKEGWKELLVARPELEHSARMAAEGCPVEVIQIENE